MLWSENDALFKNLLQKGHGWQSLPFAFLKMHGFDVVMPELRVREDITKAAEFLETYDLMIGVDLAIEVKARPFAFTSPADWPANRLPAFVDTKKKWEARAIKPFAYVYVSEPTGCMVATCGLPAARKRWKEVARFDRVRGFREVFLTTDASTLVTMDGLVKALRKKVA